MIVTKSTSAVEITVSAYGWSFAEGLGDGQDPIGRGLSDVIHRRDVAGHRQCDADGDDEDELDEEQPTGQRPASGPESATVSPRWGRLAGLIARGRYRHGGSADTGVAVTSWNRRRAPVPGRSRPATCPWPRRCRPRRGG